MLRLKLFFIVIITAIFLVISICTCGQGSYKQTFELAIEKYRVMLENTSNYDYFPRTQNTNNALIYVKRSDWTSGFYPATLWYMYEYSGDSLFLDRAKNFTASLENQKDNTKTHDLGFMMYLPYGNGYRFTADQSYPPIMQQSAKSLISRFNKTVGGTRSWDFGNWEFPIIIDNMMNLELLFWAFRHTNDRSFFNMAVSHADITLKNHFRDDYSSYHLVDYSKTTGEPLHKQTYQGNSDESSWARGQAWGLYGYAMCYRETGMKRYLEQAENIAHYFIDNLPDDFVPWWDFDLTGKTNEPRDASAAAVAASGLIELAGQTGNNYYLEVAKKIVESLSSDKYFDKNINVVGNLLLKHSTGHKPHQSEVDVPLIYADYYFIEAISRLISLEPSTSSQNIPISKNNLAIYPNPARDRVNISSDYELKKITIHDLTGKEVIATTDTRSAIHIESLRQGIYFVVAHTQLKGVTIRKKLIKL